MLILIFYYCACSSGEEMNTTSRFIAFLILLTAFTFSACIDMVGDPEVNTITYDGNGNTSGSVPTDNTHYEEGATVTVLGNTGDLARDGYTFAGWCVNSDGTGDSYTQGQTFTMGSANVTLYAKWTP